MTWTTLIILSIITIIIGIFVAKYWIELTDKYARFKSGDGGKNKIINAVEVN